MKNTKSSKHLKNTPLAVYRRSLRDLEERLKNRESSLEYLYEKYDPKGKQKQRGLRPWQLKLINKSLDSLLRKGMVDEAFLILSLCEFADMKSQIAGI